MSSYLFCGQVIQLSSQIITCNMYNQPGADQSFEPVFTPLPRKFINSSIGWVAGAIRQVEIWSAGEGLILRIMGFRDFYISPGGQSVLPVDGTPDLTDLEQEVVLGPGLVLALALGDKWCLHASAVSFNKLCMAFLGESGYGKSTLAAYLDQVGKPGWQRVADDILPVTLGERGLTGWPHFPQLKLPTVEQPGLSMPDKISLDRIILLSPINSTKIVAIERLSTNAAVKTLLGQIAGARLFTQALTAANLAFCAQAARQVSVYRLSYPHRRDILPAVRELLERCLSDNLPIGKKQTINLNDDK